MTKGTKLFEFEKGEITVLNSVRKSQKEISKADWQARKIITTIQEENCLRSRKKIHLY